MTATLAGTEELAAGLRGRLIQPHDAEYQEARQVYNGMIDKQPALIAHCTDAGDVMAALAYGRGQGMDIAIRGGGHNGGGLGTVEGGLVIDLAGIKGVRVDPKTRTARVGGGAVWGEVDHATHAFGLATPSGIIATTGVGGLTLGGGLGHLTRKYGLSIDNLLEVDMVLADGSFVTANANDHADLFWAVRGGGGNFGVVTSFLFQLHEVHTIYGGLTFWELDHAETVFKWYRDFILDQPDDLNGFLAFLTVPPGPPFPESIHLKKMCGIVWCYTGSHDQAEQVFAPVRDVAPMAFEFLGPIPHPVLQSMFDPVYPPGLQWYWKADFVQEVPDAAIDKHIEFAHKMPTMHSTMHLYPIDGAAGRVGASDTAWAYRDAKWGSVFVGVDPDPANRELITQWTRDYWEALHPYSAGGAYVNMMMDDEGQDRVQASYRHNYERLAQIKAKYDPDNVFHVNQNIKPQA